MVHRARYGDHGMWIRPAAMFLVTVVVAGLPGTRFQRLPEEPTD